MTETTTTRPDQDIDVHKAGIALTIWRVMSIVVGLGLLLVVVELVMHYGFNNKSLYWWLVPHGYLYIVYCLATAYLGFKLKWDLKRMVLLMIGAWVPFLCFFIEPRVVRMVHAQLAQASQVSN